MAKCKTKRPPKNENDLHAEAAEAFFAHLKSIEEIAPYLDLVLVRVTAVTAKYNYRVLQLELRGGYNNEVVAHSQNFTHCGVEYGTCHVWYSEE